MKDELAIARDDTAAVEPECAGARWLVSLDAVELDDDTERAFVKWIGADVRHEAEFARCDAAICLAGRLRSDPEMRWVYEEIEMLLADGPPTRRRVGPTWLTTPRTLIAAAASIGVVMLTISVFSALQPQSGSVANRGGTVADPRAQEADRLEREAPVPSAAPGSRPFEDLLAPVGAGREPVHFNAYPLATLVVRGLILIPADPSRSRLRVEMPDGTVGDVRLGDHLGVEDLKITDITATEVVLENGTRIAFRREE